MIRPSTPKEPDVGYVILERIFSRVLFPAPFFPMMPTVSPCRIDSEMVSSAQSHSSSLLLRAKSSARALAMESRRVGLELPSLYCLETLSTQMATLIVRFCSPFDSAQLDYVREAFLALTEVQETAGEHDDRQTDRNTN